MTRELESWPYILYGYAYMENENQWVHCFTVWLDFQDISRSVSFVELCHSNVYTLKMWHFLVAALAVERFSWFCSVPRVFAWWQVNLGKAWILNLAFAAVLDDLLRNSTSLRYQVPRLLWSLNSIIGCCRQQPQELAGRAYLLLLIEWETTVMTSYTAFIVTLLFWSLQVATLSWHFG